MIIGSQSFRERERDREQSINKVDLRTSQRESLRLYFVQYFCLKYFSYLQQLRTAHLFIYKVSSKSTSVILYAKINRNNIFSNEIIQLFFLLCENIIWNNFLFLQNKVIISKSKQKEEYINTLIYIFQLDTNKLL